MRRRSSDNGWSEPGGYIQAKRTKLDKQFGEKGSSTTSSIFQNVCIYVNGYTDPPASTLRDLILQHGGSYKAYFSHSSVTHTIAIRLPYSKVKKLSDQKFVTPDWIVQSIKAGKLLPWQRFQLYPIRHGGPEQQTLGIKPMIAELKDAVPNSVDRPSNRGGTNESAVAKASSSSSSSLDHSPSVKRRPIRQQRLDSYKSPIKSVGPSLVDASRQKPQEKLSLKQLLAGGPAASASSAKAQSSEIENKIHPTIMDEQLATFYARSRLHHLSSWANELGDLVRQLRSDPEHQCDLGQTWRDAMLSKLDTDKSNLVCLEARLPLGSNLIEPPIPQLKTVFHIDMDCFFVSVTLRTRPNLKDKPVAITHAAQDTARRQPNTDAHTSHSMSEVASCSYAARKAGVRNGMLLGKARLLCPDLITLPYDFEAYNNVSKQLYTTIGRFTKDIEAVSCDELYADCTNLLSVPDLESNLSGSRIKRENSTWLYQKTLIDPLQLGHHIRSLIQNLTQGCTASIGFGSTKLLARLATKKAKPNGQIWFLGLSGSQVVDPNKPTRKSNSSCWTWHRTGDKLVEQSNYVSELVGSDGEWLKQLAVSELPGIGRVICDRLNQAFGVVNCNDLMNRVSKSQLIDLLGTKTGNRIYWLCRGRDSENLCFTKECKSVSASMNYGIRLKNTSELECLVRSLCQELGSRMANVTMGTGTGCVGRSLTVRLFIRLPGAPIEPTKFMGHGACSISNHTVQLPEPTSDVDTLYRYAIGAVKRLCHEPSDLRGIGFQIHKLQSACNSSIKNPFQTLGTNLSNAPCLQPWSGYLTPKSSKLSQSKSTNESSVRGECFSSSNSPSSNFTDSTPVRTQRRRSLRLRPRSLLNTSSSNCCCDPNSELPNCPQTPDLADINLPKPTSSTICVTNPLPSPVFKPSSPNAKSSPTLPVPNPISANQPNTVALSTLVPSCSTPRTPNHLSFSRTLKPKSISPTKSKTTITTNPKPLVVKIPQSMINNQSSLDNDPTDVFAYKSPDELRHVFADWITSEATPQNEDIRILATYLVSLVPSNLERIRTVLICLNRMIKRFAYTKTWTKAYDTIMLIISKAIQNYYGSLNFNLRLSSE